MNCSNVNWKACVTMSFESGKGLPSTIVRVILRLEDTYRKNGMSDFVDFCSRYRITRNKEKQNQKLGII